jgi:chemotaxis protein CheC
VLGACLSGFGDMLQMPVSFSVPRIHVESLRSILSSLRIETGETQYAVIVATQFRLSELAVNGYLIVAVGAKSLDRISKALRDRIP